MSLSKFATYADYQASIKPIDKESTLQRLASLNAQLEAEKKAARYDWMMERLVLREISPTGREFAVFIRMDSKHMDIPGAIDAAIQRSKQ